MEELRELAQTASADVVGEMLQNKEHPEASTYFGEGKIEELREACAALGATLLIFDDELTGSQIRNIEKITGVRTIDRSTLILDIFASRARSGEGKIQVELAQLKYNLPRLSGMGTQLSRLGGGIGTRGPGETKLETDRRHIHRRTIRLKNSCAKSPKGARFSGRAGKRKMHIPQRLSGIRMQEKAQFLIISRVRRFSQRICFCNAWTRLSESWSFRTGETPFLPIPSDLSESCRTI